MSFLLKLLISVLSFKLSIKINLLFLFILSIDLIFMSFALFNFDFKFKVISEDFYWNFIYFWKFSVFLDFFILAKLMRNLFSFLYSIRPFFNEREAFHLTFNFWFQKWIIHWTKEKKQIFKSKSKYRDEGLKNVKILNIILEKPYQNYIKKTIKLKLMSLFFTRYTYNKYRKIL